MRSGIEKERFARAKKIFFAALDLDAAQHAKFIRESCGADEELRLEIESLLSVRDNARNFLKSPALRHFSFYKNLENEIVGGYRLIRKIGAGGMGLVFLAEKAEADFSRKVALKIVRGDVYSEAVIKRFDLECKILSRLEHPHIARLIDCGKTDGGLPYLVMEYVEGVPLLEYVEKNRLPLKKRLEIFRQICSAVSFAHRNAVIHRDLKPSNILVTEDGRTKLLDFGIAKLLSSTAASTEIQTAITIRAMTPEFASPEQIKAEPVTTAADVYALGVVLYKLLTGTFPYRTASGNINEIIKAVCEEEPIAPSRILTENLSQGESAKNIAPNLSSIPASQLKGDVDNIIVKALQKQPERRYSSVEAFSEDLRRHLKGLPVAARPNTVTYRLQKFAYRNRLTVTFAVLGIFALLMGGIVAVWQAQKAERQRARAERRFNDIRTLVNSFMFELNDEILKGQTQGRELVVKRALEYLDKFAAENVDDHSLQKELAVAYTKIGDIQGKPYSPNLGNTDGAIKSYRKAISILEPLADAHFENPDLRKNLAAAYAKLGSLHLTRKGKTSDAAQEINKARMIAESLFAENRQNDEYRRILSEIYKFVGDIPDDVEKRIEFYKKCVELRENMATDETEDLQDLSAKASCYQRMGTTIKGIASTKMSKKKISPFEVEKILFRVLDNFNKSSAIYTKLASIEPENSRHRRNAADIWAMTLPIYADLGNEKTVRENYQKAIETFEQLSAADPTNFEARFDIAFTQDYMCRSLIKLNSFAEAEIFCRQALNSGKNLLAIDPSNDEARQFVYESHSFYAVNLTRNGYSREALRVLNQLISIIEKWSTDENTSLDYAVSDKIGNIYVEQALKEKNNSVKQKENWQTARYWFERSLKDLGGWKNRRTSAENLSLKIKKIEQKVSDCDTALKRLSY